MPFMIVGYKYKISNLKTHLFSTNNFVCLVYVLNCVLKLVKVFKCQKEMFSSSLHHYVFLVL